MKDGQVINLGIGVPTFVANYTPPGVDVVIHSENGAVGVGPAPQKYCDDPDRANAGGAPITLVGGGSYFDSATSFGMIRGGHVDMTFLGTLQVDGEGNIASYEIPGKLVAGMGGAMDLLAGAKIVNVVTEHCSKDGETKLVKKCTYPFTGAGEADVIITERALFRRYADKPGFVLEEVARGLHPRRHRRLHRDGLHRLRDRQARCLRSRARTVGRPGPAPQRRPAARVRVSPPRARLKARPRSFWAPPAARPRAGRRLMWGLGKHILVAMAIVLWIGAVVYPDPRPFVNSVGRLKSPPIDAAAATGLAATLPDDYKAIEDFTLGYVPFATAWDVYGLPWYFPTVAEVVRDKAGDARRGPSSWAASWPRRACPTRCITRSTTSGSTTPASRRPPSTTPARRSSPMPARAGWVGYQTRYRCALSSSSGWPITGHRCLSTRRSPSCWECS